MGQVLTAGAGQIPARQAAVAGGIPMSVPALTINKVCLSGIDAIALADQLIRAGNFDVVVAGGQESMTRAPHMLAKSRAGLQIRRRDVDATTSPTTGCTTSSPIRRWVRSPSRRNPLTRDEQDEFAAASHQRAAAAWKNGVFDDEVVPVSIPQRNGDSDRVRRGRRHSRGHHRRIACRRLRPAFSKTGTITAGNASTINDGAAAVVVMSKAKAIELGLTWIAEIGAHGVVAGPDSTLQQQPANAIAAACAHEGIDPRRSISSRSTKLSPQWGSRRPAYWVSIRRR